MTSWRSTENLTMPSEVPWCNHLGEQLDLVRLKILILDGPGIPLRSSPLMTNSTQDKNKNAPGAMVENAHGSTEKKKQILETTQIS